MADRLTGRVALVTGAAQGIGEAIARRFAGEGAQVVAVDRNGAALALLANALPGLTPFAADIADHAALERCVTAMIANHNQIDILVNNAGFQYTVPFLESTLDE